MSFNSVRLLTAIAATLLAGPAFAQTGAAATSRRQPRRAAAKPIRAPTIVKKIDGIKLEDVRMSPLSGVYEVTRGLGDQLRDRATVVTPFSAT